ncbi:hypothetical protein QTG54_004131 [Skeletonema marinoi]|uniref:Uncharacterized protein n=1 Tax=Skeletonema marinoi TaxID=267567 RepID=A0AAD9DGC0_9STRA|nr:hypothetical protein QTG54_004131 [Skeletonema marinoi]
MMNACNRFSSIAKRRMKPLLQPRPIWTHSNNHGWICLPLEKLSHDSTALDAICADTKALMEGLWMMEKSATDDNAQQQQLVIQAKKEAYESSAGILELALIEFPGCALLHLYNLENLIAYICECGDIGSSNKVSSAFLKAWQSVGRGRM